MFSVVGQFLTRSYNAGTSAVCKSPMLARINDGDFRGACAALLTKQKGNYNGWLHPRAGQDCSGPD
ncbi:MULTISPECIES: glycoside hydrolase family protein [Bradyrhizobium]|uniref:glycoside hydrolase family protein n=1 Tax=Bradyrhizobium elkanii TaxID=29448 RepID=UPI0035D876FD